MNVLLLTSHSIAEHDDLDMFTRMGVPTFSIGAYTYPNAPTDDKRPPLPKAPVYPDLAAATERQRARLAEKYGEPGPFIDWAKANLAPEVIDWADTIIVHHFPEQWIGGNWPRIRHKRVIWRTCGQSDPRLEASMLRYTRDGLQVVRYSPREFVTFDRAGVYAGEDAMIRFGKDPAEWAGWRGDDPVVGNITQHMAQRGDACGYSYWEAGTAGLPTKPAGPGSEALRGGIGTLTYEGMREYLRAIRVYLYTGTRPASYTLGLIEALMTGVPVVCIGPGAFGIPDLLEWDLASDAGPSLDDPREANRILRRYLDQPPAQGVNLSRERAIAAFGLDRVMDDWRRFLGLREAVAA